VGEVDRAAIVAQLIERGTRKDLAVQYVDAFLEYREASTNIAEHGVVVLHPRTSNPITNPYVDIRDRALRKLQRMYNVEAGWLW